MPFRSAGLILVLMLPVNSVLLAGSIRDVDFKAFLSKQAIYADCEDGVKVETNSITFADLDKDGSDEALVTASSCMTGTAGPDIHGVFKLDESGAIVELPIQEPPTHTYANLIGNRNYQIFESNGFLVRKWHDSSGRDKPLTEYFKWNGHQFTLARKESSKSALPDHGADGKNGRR